MKGNSEYSMQVTGEEMSQTSIRVVLADDHPVVRQGINSILTYDEQIKVVGEASDGFETQKVCQEKSPDILLLDLSMPGPKLTDLIQGIREVCKTIKIMVLSAHDDDIYVREVIKAGVEGYLLKEEAPDVVTKAVHSIYSGSTWFSQPIVEKLVQWQFGVKSDAEEVQLTKREKEILTLLAKGFDNGKIADNLGLAEQTIRNYVSTIYEKVDVHTRAEAIVWAIDSGYNDY